MCTVRKHSLTKKKMFKEFFVIFLKNFLKVMIEKMDDDTTLVVWGDHGMTVEGSHGGNSDLEMNSTLFAY